MSSISIPPLDLDSSLRTKDGISLQDSNTLGSKRTWDRRRSSESELIEEIHGGKNFNRFKRRRAVGIMDHTNRTTNKSLLLASIEMTQVFSKYSMHSPTLSSTPELLPSPDFRFPPSPTTFSPETPSIILPTHKALQPRIRSTSLPVIFTSVRSHSITRKWDSARILSLHFDKSKQQQLNSPLMNPPISTKTLKGLDLEQILRNSQLRHDIYFEPNLILSSPLENQNQSCLKQNISHDQYWTSIFRELSTGCRCTTFNSQNEILPCLCLFPLASKKIPLTLRMESRIGPLVIALREILSCLLPSSNSAPCDSSPTLLDLIEHLDPVYMEEQAENGEMELDELARHLGVIFKLHCAPVRDVLVDELVSCLAVKEDYESIVKGLRMTFEILELMKMDIVNHQLRALRPSLIQTALEFEQKSLQLRLKAPTFTFTNTESWFLKSSTSFTPSTTNTFTQIPRIVCEGLSSLIFPSTLSSPSNTIPSTFPETLRLDALRINNFQSDATEITVVHMLILLFQQISSPSKPTPEEIDQFRSESWAIMSSIPISSSANGLDRLDCPNWRKGMEDVLLNLAVRVQKNKLQIEGKFSHLIPLPDSKAISFIQSYFNNNIKSTSPLFKILRSRLQSTLLLVVNEIVEKHQARTLTDGLRIMTSQVETDGRRLVATGGCRVRNAAAMVPKHCMASSIQTQDRKNENVMDVVEEVVEITSELELALKKSGLKVLEIEVDTLGKRVAKVVCFHLACYTPYYSTLLEN